MTTPLSKDDGIVRYYYLKKTIPLLGVLSSGIDLFTMNKFPLVLAGPAFPMAVLHAALLYLIEYSVEFIYSIVIV